MTVLELVNFDVTLVVINVTGTNFFFSSVVSGEVGVNSVFISIDVFLFKENELVVVTRLVDL